MVAYFLSNKAFRFILPVVFVSAYFLCGSLFSRTATYNIIASGQVDLVRSPTPRETRSVCADDEFKYGAWTKKSGHNQSCHAYEFLNASCGSSFDKETFCQRSLRCRSMLLVGDSLVHTLFDAFSAEFTENTPIRSLKANLTHCPPNQNPHFTLRICSLYCEKEVNLTYIRHDYLVGDYGRDAGSACDWAALTASHKVLAISTGAHVHHVVDDHLFGSWYPIHAEKVAALLKRLALTDVVYVKPHWGLTGNTRNSLEINTSKTRLQVNGDLISHEFMWNLIPLVADIYAVTLKKEVNALVVDPSIAFALRRDCRRDYLHMNPSVVQNSVLSMLQNALLDQFSGSVHS